MVPLLSVSEKLDQLHALISDIDTAMMTTVSSDGCLVSRPMSTQARDPGVDLWFMTTIQSRKCEEILDNPHVNLAYFNPRSGEWVSVNGYAVLNKDLHRIQQLYKPGWKIWLPDEGGARDGGPNDPRIVLIEVKAISATYLVQDRPAVFAAFSMMKGFLTGSPPHVGHLDQLDEGQLRNERAGARHH